jgi:hypothetical protein
LPHSLFDVVRALAKMAVARIDVAPGVDNRDDRLARVIRLRTTHGSGSRTMPEGTQIVRAIPAIASQ